MTAARLSPRGLAAATAAFSIWGLFPVYLHPLSGVPALQVIAHRVTWGCLFIFGWMLLRGELAGLSATLTNSRLVARLMLTALLVSCNWLVYVWSVTHAHIVDTSLGYYISPLMNVLFGYGARALPASTVGVLQYIAPSLQLLCGVLIYHESFGPALATGFALIWLALLIYAADGLWRARGAARAVRA